MAESSTTKGWIKTIIGTVAGLLSGAVMMYLTPLVQKVLAPAKPVANFEKQTTGLTVVFHNRATGAAQGWWDFGDGSALEPFASNHESVQHTYANPGDYTVKLTVRNVINDEDQRSVPLHLDSDKPTSPEIQALEVVPISPRSYAPATFRVTTRVKNAQVCVWDIGDDRPLEFLTDSLDSQDRLVTIKKAGGYVIKLAALNGTHAVEKTEIANVVEPPSGVVTATLSVTDQGTRVRTLNSDGKLAAVFPPDETKNLITLDQQLWASQGYTLADVRVAVKDGPSLGSATEMALEGALVGAQGARNLRLQLAADRRSVHLTGTLEWSTNFFGKRDRSQPGVVVPVVLVQERRDPVARPAVPVTASLTVPGTTTLTLPPMPHSWVDAQRTVRLEVRDGEQVVLQETQLPRSAPLTLHKRDFTLTTTVTGDQVRIDLLAAPAGPAPSAN